MSISNTIKLFWRDISENRKRILKSSGNESKIYLYYRPEMNWFINVSEVVRPKRNDQVNIKVNFQKLVLLLIQFSNYRFRTFLIFNLSGWQSNPRTTISVCLHIIFEYDYRNDVMGCITIEKMHMICKHELSRVKLKLWLGKTLSTTLSSIDTNILHFLVLTLQIHCLFSPDHFRCFI